MASFTVHSLYDALDGLIPRSLSCDWDNDGLSCCPNPDAPVTGVLVALDPTEEAVELAAGTGCNVLLTHHPLLFRGLKTVDGRDTNSRKVIRMIGAGISSMAFHTRLDALNGGVNDALAAALGLAGAVAFGEASSPAGNPMGRMGTLPHPLPMESFAEYVAGCLTVPATLGVPAVGGGTLFRFTIPGSGECAEAVATHYVEHLTPVTPRITYAGCGRPAHAVAVVGGAGEDEITAAIRGGADTFVTGELGYHRLCDAPYGPINLVEAGHYFTEFPVCRSLAALVAWICPNLPIHLMGGTRVRSV